MEDRLTSSLRQLLVIGRYREKRLFDWEYWAKLHPIIESLVKSTGKPVTVLCNQADLSAKGYKPVRFGKLNMSMESAKLWTHNSPVSKHLSDKWEFESVAIWSPSWQTCDKLGCNPIVFLEIVNNQLADFGPSAWDFGLILACDEAKLDMPLATWLSSFIGILSTLCEIQILADRVAGWGTARGGGTVTNALVDFLTISLPRKKWRESAPMFGDLPDSQKWHQLSLPPN